MIQKLAGAGRLDFMQQIVLLHSPLPEGESFCYEAWHNAMVAASWTGRMATLKWLVEHPMGQPICDYMKSRRNLFSFVCIAGNQDQLQVMQYVYDLGAVNEVSEPHVVDISERCLMAAIRRGCYKTVKWFIERVRFPSQGIVATSAVTTAARCGRLNILRLFYEMGSVDSAHSEQNHSSQVATWRSQPRDAIRSAAEKGCLEMIQWLLLNFPKNCPKEAMDLAAAGGSLEVVQWLDANTSEGCTTDAMDKAAESGHLNVVKWLHANRSEGCTATAMDEAASMGRLDVVQWLHENRNEGCTTQAMDNAARNGHLAMVQWLHANRSEGCTANAMNNAVKLGHPTVATWLNTHFPQHGLTAADVTVATFEMLLYLHTNFAHLFTSQFVKDLRRKFRSAYNQGHVVAWLNENFPSS